MQSFLNLLFILVQNANAAEVVCEGDEAKLSAQGEGRGHSGTAVEGECKWAMWPSNRLEIRTTMYG